MHVSRDVIVFIKQGLSFFELPISSLSLLDPYFDYVGVNISLNDSSSLSFFNVYASFICTFSTDGRTNPFSPYVIPSSRNLHSGVFQLPSPLWNSNWYFPPPWRGSVRLGRFLCSLPLNDPYILTFLAVAPPQTSRLLPLPLSCSWEVLQNLGSDHLPILLTVPPFLWSFAPTNVSLP